MLLEATTESLSRTIDECNKDTMKLYSLINNLTGSKTENPMPDAKSDEALVNTFTAHFIEKISIIRDELWSHPEHSPEHRNTGQLIQFHPVSAEYVSKTIRNWLASHVSWTWYQPHYLKRLLLWIIGKITDIINVSITTGIFLTEQKITIIRPLLQKLSLTLIHSNYRPVSSLPFLSKVVEKLVPDQFKSHWTKHRLISDYQSAYHVN